MSLNNAIPMEITKENCDKNSSDISENMNVADKNDLLDISLKPKPSILQNVNFAENQRLSIVNTWMDNNQQEIEHRPSLASRLLKWNLYDPKAKILKKSATRSRKIFQLHEENEKLSNKSNDACSTVPSDDLSTSNRMRKESVVTHRKSPDKSGQKIIRTETVTKSGLPYYLIFNEDETTCAETTVPSRRFDTVQKRTRTQTATRLPSIPSEAEEETETMTTSPSLLISSNKQKRMRFETAAPPPSISSERKEGKTRAETERSPSLLLSGTKQKRTRADTATPPLSIPSETKRRRTRAETMTPPSSVPAETKGKKTRVKTGVTPTSLLPSGTKMWTRAASVTPPSSVPAETAVSAAPSLLLSGTKQRRTRAETATPPLSIPSETKRRRTRAETMTPPSSVPAETKGKKTRVKTGVTPTSLLPSGTKMWTRAASVTPPSSVPAETAVSAAPSLLLSGTKQRRTRAETATPPLSIPSETKRRRTRSETMTTPSSVPAETKGKKTRVKTGVTPTSLLPSGTKMWTRAASVTPPSSVPAETAVSAAPSLLLSGTKQRRTRAETATPPLSIPSETKRRRTRSETMTTPSSVPAETKGKKTRVKTGVTPTSLLPSGTKMWTRAASVTPPSSVPAETKMKRTQTASVTLPTSVPAETKRKKARAETVSAGPTLLSGTQLKRTRSETVTPLPSIPFESTGRKTQVETSTAPLRLPSDIFHNKEAHGTIMINNPSLPPNIFDDDETCGKSLYCPPSLMSFAFSAAQKLIGTDSLNKAGLSMSEISNDKVTLFENVSLSSEISRKDLLADPVNALPKRSRDDEIRISCSGLSTSETENHEPENFEDELGLSDDSVADPDCSKTKEKTPKKRLLVDLDDCTDGDASLSSIATEPPVKRRTNKTARWHKRNPDAYSRSKNQVLRAQCLPYTNAKKKKMAAKTPGPSCNCRMKCYERFTEERRSVLCKAYWGLADYKRQKDFILMNVKISSPRTRLMEAKKPRGVSRQYYLNNGESKSRVCEKNFKSTLCISNGPVIKAFEELGLAGNFHGTDKRGKKEPANKTPKDAENYVKKHIESFPTMESHYCRKTSSKFYLESNLSIPKMYELYEEKCKEDSVTPVSINVYRRIFCTQYNYEFHKTKKDQCSTCHKYFMAKAENSENLASWQEKYDLHISMKEKSQEAKELDKTRANTDETFRSITMDLQKVLHIPNSKVSLLYYLRKLNVYNATLYEARSPNDGFCFLWNELNGKKGSDEIGTALYLWIQQLPPEVTEISIFTDTCGGQNRNQYIMSLLLYLVQNTKINIIEQKYLESGHSHMEVDSIHSAIEHQLKAIPVFLMNDYCNIIKLARSNRKKKGEKKKPYQPIVMEYTDILNLKDLKSKLITNRNTGKDKMQWLKVKCFRYEKKRPGIVLYRYDYESEYKEFDVRGKEKEPKRKSQRKNKEKQPEKPFNFNDYELQKAYQSLLPITSAKKKDLLKMCTEKNVPIELHHWYENIPAKDGPDFLPDEDMPEELQVDGEIIC